MARSNRPATLLAMVAAYACRVATGAIDKCSIVAGGVMFKGAHFLTDGVVGSMSVKISVVPSNEAGRSPRGLCIIVPPKNLYARLLETLDDQTRQLWFTRTIRKLDFAGTEDDVIGPLPPHLISTR
jgi:hypothetical protein